MKVQAVSQSSQVESAQPSEVVQRLQSITSIIGQKRAQGAEQVDLVLRDNAVDQQVVERLSRLYKVYAETNEGNSIKVNVRFRS
jgi:hypothetical protein